ncbi:hypothetical protein KEM54_001666 [Ascosphaera aggregata]|nr:hypothetical protein KEM54_001666 [Ascosphaera aggregata]
MVGTQAATKPDWHNTLQLKTAQKWAQWEQAESGWKKHLVQWGDRVMQRVPFQEWGLKSVPSLRSTGAQRRQPVDLLYPKNVMHESTVLFQLKKLATERQTLHRQRMWWSLMISPLTAPIAIIPLVPNIPFFYLMYRAWSHWRALEGTKHLQYLLDNRLVKPRSPTALEAFYAKNKAVVNDMSVNKNVNDDTPSKELKEHEKDSEDSNSGILKEDIWLKHDDGKKLAEILQTPELIAEVERAVFQVRNLHGEQNPKDLRKSNRKQG